MGTIELYLAKLITNIRLLRRADTSVWRFLRYLLDPLHAAIAVGLVALICALPSTRPLGNYQKHPPLHDAIGTGAAYALNVAQLPLSIVRPRVPGSAELARRIILSAASIYVLLLFATAIG